MSYIVELTEGAYADLDRLTAALEERWPEGSERVIARFYAALPRLESFPLACGLAYESQFFPYEVRHLLFEIHKGRTYRALFNVQDDRVRVLAVRAPGEKPITPEDIES
jgi:plasmid stabilization system protein ParE